MTKKYKSGLFIFRRDLRLEDNKALYECVTQCERVHACFVFTPEQVGAKNDYRSANAIQFMIESLFDLENRVRSIGGKLVCLKGKNNEVISSVIAEISPDAIFFNMDYTPYARERDATVRKICERANIPCIESHDYYLHVPGSVLTGSGSVYKKYTPFYNAVLHLPVDKPIVKRIKNIHSSSFGGDYIVSLKEMQRTFHQNPDIMVRAGRDIALSRLEIGKKKQPDYDKKRDFFTYDTTHLSAYIKFGNLSIREVFHTFASTYGIEHGVIRELIWRDFFAHVLFGYPEVLGQAYVPRYRKLKWRRSQSDFENWCNGTTGIPIVDAGMRQMNKTGYMHNRARMMCATFLVKTLLLDWRLGERYYAQKLTDYDVASNNGNWQAISGTGVDMKPYYRVMSPWTQSRKYDPKCEYIRTWVHELKDVPDRDIHEWDEKWKDHKGVYKKPIADVSARTEEMIAMYKAV